MSLQAGLLPLMPSPILSPFSVAACTMIPVSGDTPSFPMSCVAGRHLLWVQPLHPPSLGHPQAPTRFWGDPLGTRRLLVPENTEKGNWIDFTELH